jgi:hypothetical protein
MKPTSLPSLGRLLQQPARASWLLSIASFAALLQIARLL